MLWPSTRQVLTKSGILYNLKETTDWFIVEGYNKLAIRKIEPLEIVEKINPNARQLKLPSHIKMSDVFNVKHNNCSIHEIFIRL
jgi:hypothetical protein